MLSENTGPAYYKKNIRYTASRHLLQGVSQQENEYFQASGLREIYIFLFKT